MVTKRFNGRKYKLTGRGLSKAGAATLIKMWVHRGFFARKTKEGSGYTVWHSFTKE